MTDTELARIIEQMQAAWANGTRAEGGLPVDPRLEVNRGSIVKVNTSQTEQGPEKWLTYIAGPGFRGDYEKERVQCLAAAPSWVCQLIAELYRLRGICHDFEHEYSAAIRQGERQERSATLYCMQDVQDAWARAFGSEESAGARDARSVLDDVRDKLSNMPTADQLPPEQSMREILRLREALRAIAHCPAIGTRELMRSIAHEALGEVTSTDGD